MATKSVAQAASAFQEGLATMLHTQSAMFRLSLLKLTKVKNLLEAKGVN